MYRTVSLSVRYSLDWLCTIYVSYTHILVQGLPSLIAPIFDQNKGADIHQRSHFQDRLHQDLKSGGLHFMIYSKKFFLLANKFFFPNCKWEIISNLWLVSSQMGNQIRTNHSSGERMRWKLVSIVNDLRMPLPHCLCTPISLVNKKQMHMV